MTETPFQGIHTLAFRAMGSQMLAAVECGREQVDKALAGVPGRFEEWEQVLSRFREESELSRLNRTAGNPDPIPVSDTLWEVLLLALQVANDTDGLVTPTLLNALEDAGYRTSFDFMLQSSTQYFPPSSRTTRRGAGHVNWRDIELYPETRWVRLPEGVRLDFGGIAKGWAADKALVDLAAHGPALVDAGGDIAVSGPRLEGGGWLIGVDPPWRGAASGDDPIEMLSLDSGGVATSGRDYRRWRQNGLWQHHIIDPHTDLPAVTDVLSATLVAPSTREAESAAKVVMLLGSARGLEWVEQRAALAALLVLDDGRVLHSSRLRNYLWSEKNGN